MNKRCSQPLGVFVLTAMALAVIVHGAFAADTVPTTSATSAPAPAPSSSTTPASAAPATYSVNISPDWKVGQKFGYVADDMSNDPDGTTKIHFEADGEVLALLPSGNPQKVAYTVKALHVSGPDLVQGNFPHPGSTLVIEFAPNGKRNVTLYDHPLDPDIAGVLEGVLWLTIRNHTDHEIFGPAHPVAIGATWPLNTAAYLDFHEEGDPIYTSAAGTLTLQSIDGTGDNRVGVITGTFNLKGQNPPDDPGSFAGQFKFTGSAPLNHVGVFKESVSSNTTTTPATTLTNFLTKSSTTSQETVTEEITVN
jgi:hypothetical protein